MRAPRLSRYAVEASETPATKAPISMLKPMRMLIAASTIAHATPNSKVSSGLFEIQSRTFSSTNFDANAITPKNTALEARVTTRSVTTEPSPGVPMVTITTIAATTRMS